jgi:hypothetical protein
MFLPLAGAFACQQEKHCLDVASFFSFFSWQEKLGLVSPAFNIHFPGDVWAVILCRATT